MADSGVKGLAKDVEDLAKALGKLNEVDKNVNEFLDKLAGNFAKLATAVSAFPTQKFKGFTDAINDLTNLKAPTAAKINRAVSALATAAQNLGTIDTNKLVKLKAISTILRDTLRGFGSLSLEQSRATKALQAISTFIKTLRGVVETSGDIGKLLINAGFTNRAGDAVDALKSILLKLSETGNINLDNLKKVSRIFNAIGELTKAMVRFSQTDASGVDVEARLKNLNSAIQALKRGIGSLSGIDSKNLPGIARAIGAINKIVKTFSGDTTLTFGISKIKDVFENIKEAIEDFAKIPTGKANASIASIGRLLSAINTMLTQVGFKQLNLDVMTEIGLAFKRLATALGAFSKVDPKGFDVIGKLLTALNKTLSDFAKDSKPNVDLIKNTFGELAKALGAFSSVRSGGFAGIASVLDAVRRMIADFEKINLPDGILRGHRKLSQFVRGIRPLMKILADAMKPLATLPNIANFHKLSKVLLAIPELINAFSKIPMQKSSLDFAAGHMRLTRFFRGIRPLMKILADAMKPLATLPNITSFHKLARFFEAIPELINTFSKIPMQKSSLDFAAGHMRLTRFFRGIRPLAKVLRDAIKTLSSVKGDPRKMEAVGTMIRALGKVMQEGVKAGAFADPSKLGNFAAGVHAIAKALAEGLGSAEIKIDFKNVGVKAAQQTLDGMNEEFETKSPSRATMRIGMDLVRGLIAGIKKIPLVDVARKFADAFFVPLLKFLATGGIKASAAIRKMASDMRRTAQQQFRGGLFKVSSGGIMAFLFGATAQSALDFRQVLNQIQIFGKLTRAELNETQAAIEAFSAATIFGPTEAAEAFLGLQKAGLGVAEAMTVLPDIGNLAAAANLELAAATDLVIQTMNGFGLGVQDATRIVNTFVAGADISTAEVADLAQAMGFIGPTAKQMGISIEEVNAALALLSDRGIKGQRAGTGLRAILQSLVSPTKAAADTLKELGITLQDTEGNFVGMDELIRQFSTSINEMRAAGMGDIEIIDALSDIGDRNAISALFALIDEGSGAMITLADGTEVAATAFDEYLASLDGATTAQELAATQMDTLKGRLTSLRGSVQNLKNRALDPLFEGVLKPIVEVVIEWINALTKLDQNILSTIAGIGLLIPLMITLVGVFQILTSLLLYSLIPAISAFGVVLSVVFNPLGFIKNIILFTAALAAILPVVLALGAVFAGLAFFIKQAFADIKNDVGGAGLAFARFKSAVSGFFTELGAVIGAAIGFIKTFRGETASAGDAAVTAFSPIASIFNAISSALEGLTARMAGFRESMSLFTDLSAFSGMTDRDFAFAAARETISNESERNSLIERRIELERQIRGLQNGELEFMDDLITANGEYIVQAGDTLTAIANQYGISLQDLIDANPEIADPNLIFTGQEIVIPGINTESVDEAIAAMQQEWLALDEQIANMELIPGVTGADVMNRELSSLQRRFVAFGQTSIGQRLGFDAPGEVAMLRALAIIEKIEFSFHVMGTRIRQIGRGLRLLFGGQTKRGLRLMERGFAGVALEVLRIVETLFGLEIPEAIEDALISGDLGAAFMILAQSAVQGILNLGEEIASVLGFALEFAIRTAFLGIPRLLLNIFDIDTFDPVFDVLDGFAETAGDILQSGIENLFAVLRGDISPGAALKDFFADTVAAIEEDPNLSKIKDAIEGAFDGIDFTIIETKIDDLKSAFEEMSNSEGVQSFLKLFGEIVDEFIKLGANIAAVVAFGLVSGALTVFKNAVNGLEPILVVLTPAFESFKDALVRLNEQIDAAKLRDDLESVGIGIAAIIAIINLSAILPVVVGLIALGGAIAVFVGVIEGLSESFDEGLTFLAALGDFIKAITTGDLGEAARVLEDELTPAFVDFVREFLAGGTEIKNNELHFGGFLSTIQEIATVITEQIFGAEEGTIAGGLYKFAELIENLGIIVSFLHLKFNLAWKKILLGLQLFLNDASLFMLDAAERIPGMADLLGIDDPEAIRASLQPEVEIEVQFAEGMVESATTELENAERRIDELAEDILSGGKTTVDILRDIQIITTREGLQNYQSQLDAMIDDPRFADIRPELINLRARAEFEEIELVVNDETFSGVAGNFDEIAQESFEIAFSDVLSGIDIGDEASVIAGYSEIISQLFELGLDPELIKEIIAGFGIGTILSDALVENFNEIGEIPAGELTFDAVFDLAGIDLDFGDLEGIFDDQLVATGNELGAGITMSTEGFLSTFSPEMAISDDDLEALFGETYVRTAVNAFTEAMTLGFSEVDAAQMLRDAGVDETLIAAIQENASEILSGDYEVEVPELGFTITPSDIFADINIEDIIAGQPRGGLDNVIALLGLDELTPEQEAFVTSSLSSLITDALSAGMAPEDITSGLADLGINAALTDAVIADVQGLSEGEEFASSFEEIGIAMIDGMIVGIETQAPALEETMTEASTNVFDAQAAFWETKSPSAKMKRFGMDIVQGMINGIKNKRTGVAESLTEILSEFIVFQDKLVIILDGIARSIAETFNIQVPNLPLPNAGGGGGAGAIPSFHTGGSTGSGRGEFLAMLKGSEYVVPESGALVIRQPDPVTGGSNNAYNVTMTYGDININIPEGVSEVTPDIIAEGMRQHAEANPPQRILRNKL